MCGWVISRALSTFVFFRGRIILYWSNSESNFRQNEQMRWHFVERYIVQLSILLRCKVWTWNCLKWLFSLLYLCHKDGGYLVCVSSMSPCLCVVCLSILSWIQQYKGQGRWIGDLHRGNVLRLETGWISLSSSRICEGLFVCLLPVLFPQRTAFRIFCMSSGR